MSGMSFISHVMQTQNLRPCKSLLLAGLMVCGFPCLSLAQEKTRISTPELLQAVTTQNKLEIKPKVDKDVIVGTWGVTRVTEDKAFKESETTIIVFNPDGTYTTRLRNSNFPDWEKLPMSGGRYAVSGADKAGFTLALERTSGDPEEDKSTARSVLAVSIVDEKTLRAPDGAVLIRTK